MNTESASAELSSVGSQIEDLTRTVLGTAREFDTEGGEQVASELYEVERALRSASRRLQRAAKELDRG
jgi:hypothetical protein